MILSAMTSESKAAGRTNGPPLSAASISWLAHGIARALDWFIPIFPNHVTAVSPELRDWFVGHGVAAAKVDMMIREIAKDPECVGKISGAAAGLIWAISLVVCVVVGVIALFLPFGNDMKIAVMLMTLATLGTFHAAGYSAVLRAFEDNELNYLGFILQKILFLALILVMLHFRTGMVGFVTAHLLSNLFMMWCTNAR